MRILPGIISAAGGAGGTPDLLTGLYECWEFDEASFGNAGGTEQAPTAGLYWKPNNGVADAVGLLDGGAGDGACDMTNSSGAYRFLLAGTDAAHNTDTEKAEIFGAGAVKRDFSYSLWFYPTVIPVGSTYGVLLSCTLDNRSVGWWLRINGTTKPNPGQLAWTFPGASPGQAVSANQVQLNKWNLVVCSFDFSELEMRMWHGWDSTLQAPILQTPDQGPLTHTGQLHMKAVAATANYPGQFRADQSAIWTNRALTQVDVDDLFNGGAGKLKSTWT